jgi:hypothetical protein
MAEQNIVHIEVSGLTGSGKSAVYTEIATALTAIGLKVEHANPNEAAGEMRLNGLDQLEMYSPRVHMSERNVARAAPKSLSGMDWHRLFFLKRFYGNG